MEQKKARNQKPSPLNEGTLTKPGISWHLFFSTLTLLLPGYLKEKAIMQ